jgi:hypothetical protein
MLDFFYGSEHVTALAGSCHPDQWNAYWAPSQPKVHLLNCPLPLSQLSQ